LQPLVKDANSFHYSDSTEIGFPMSYCLTITQVLIV
jgi:hypothetical protein